MKTDLLIGWYFQAGVTLRRQCITNPSNLPPPPPGLQFGEKEIFSPKKLRILIEMPPENRKDLFFSK